MNGGEASPALTGLVLAGGQSRRMGRDKAGLCYGDGNVPAWQRTAELLAPFCRQVMVSIRPGQTLLGLDNLSHFAMLADRFPDAGPMGGILTAWEAFPEEALLVVACDLPLLDQATLDCLSTQRDTACLATAYRSARDGLPEPLCAIYEPSLAQIIREALAAGLCCPRKVLIQQESRVRLLTLPDEFALENANTPEDFKRLKSMSHPPS